MTCLLHSSHTCYLCFRIVSKGVWWTLPCPLKPNTTLTTYFRYNGILQDILQENILYLLGAYKSKNWQHIAVSKEGKRNKTHQPHQVHLQLDSPHCLHTFISIAYFKELMHENFIHSQGYFNMPELWTTEQVKPTQVSQHNGIKSTATQQVA